MISVILVGADDQLRQELVRQAVKVAAVELGIGTRLEIGFYEKSVGYSMKYISG